MTDWDEEDWSEDDRPADDGTPETVPCPACGAEVYEDAERCPACGDWITHRRTGAAAFTGPSGVRPLWWVVLGVAGVLATVGALLAVW